MDIAVENEMEVLQVKLDLVRNQMPFVGLAAFFVSLIVAYVMWGIYEHWLVGLWFCSVILVSGLRYFLSESFKDSSLAAQKNIQLVGAFVAGMLWASGAFMFATPEHPELLAFVISFCIGVTAGSLPALSPLLPVYCCFAVPCMGGLALRLITLDFPYTTELFIFALGFLVMNLLFCRNLQKTTTRVITLDFKNAHLLADVNRAREEAESANTAKSRFLAAASHDLRQPLHALGLFLESLGKRINDEVSLKLFTNIRNSYDALEALFTALLEVSKLDAGRVKVNKGHFSLKPVLEDLFAQVEQEVGLKDIGCQLNCEDVVVYSDVVLLQRILRNFLINSVKYTESGSIILKVEKFNAHVRISVSDTGIGIPGSEIDNVFSEYHQLNNQERDRNKGLGLGLAVVKRMALLLEYNLGLESDLGVGSTFYIDVPLGDVSQLQAKKPEQSWVMDLTGAKILIVDDEVTILEGMKMLLEGWGCEVVVADSSSEALKQLARHGFELDVLISDYRLRAGETGIVVIDEVRRYCQREVPALLISGDTDPELLKKIHEQNYSMLHKPIKAAHLYKVLAGILK